MIELPGFDRVHDRMPPTLQQEVDADGRIVTIQFVADPMFDDGVYFHVSVPAAPTGTVLEDPPHQNYFPVYDIDSKKQVDAAYDQARDWGCRQARCASAADIVRYASITPPDMDWAGVHISPAHELAKGCVTEEGCVMAGPYLVDCSEIIEECPQTPCAGGVYGVGSVDVEVTLRCLLSPLMTGHRWIAVYEVDEA